MFLYSLARKVNSKIKAKRKADRGRYLHPVRRIEFVCPPQNGRFCAMTFDDGPMALPTNPGGEKGLTAAILDILKDYEAYGTFDVIGDTSENYPDSEGKLNDFSWSGVFFDHYPRFGRDDMGGAVHQGELLARMMREGHEISNHGYRHVLFGPMGFNYAKRKHFSNIKEVIADLERLDNLLLNEYKYKMKLARPPHYIDKTKDGHSAYDAYQSLGYQYLAASFDGAGWLPRTGDYDEYVEHTMVAPLREALKADPDALNGKIIFQKDGYNMSLETPIADALPKQLALLQQYGYRVIPVSELLSLSPVEDVSQNDLAYPHLKKLLDAQHAAAYQNNSFQGQREITYGEILMMLCPPEVFRTYRGSGKNSPYDIAYAHFKNNGLNQLLPLCTSNTLDKKAEGRDFLSMAANHGIEIEEHYFKDKVTVERQYAVTVLSQLI